MYFRNNLPPKNIKRKKILKLDLLLFLEILPSKWILEPELNISKMTQRPWWFHFTSRNRLITFESQPQTSIFKPFYQSSTETIPFFVCWSNQAWICFWKLFSEGFKTISNKFVTMTKNINNNLHNVNFFVGICRTI